MRLQEGGLAGADASLSCRREVGQTLADRGNDGRTGVLPCAGAFFFSARPYGINLRGPAATITGGHEEAAWMLGVMKRTRYSSQHDLPAIVTRMKELLTSARNKDKLPRGLYHSIKDVRIRLSDVDVMRLRTSAEGRYAKFDCPRAFLT